MKQPTIIQGGMGIGVSNWVLAKSVAMAGQLGVISGTAMGSVLVRQLQDGDPGGHRRRALANFPNQQAAQDILKNYFLEGGRPAGKAYKLAPMHTMPPTEALDLLTAAACFTEVYLAKEGHDGLVGMNLLEKIQLPNLASLYGAMLAGVDYVIMGAGIPREIPGALDAFSKGETATLKIQVEDAKEQIYSVSLDPKRIAPLEASGKVKRPQFLAVVSSGTLALNLAKRATGYVDGFVIENKTAGGHNAPPRGPLKLSERGEPIYGPKDDADLVTFREIGRPFWLAGSYATPERLQEALREGAAGVQVGTAFAYSNESGLATELKAVVLARIRASEEVQVFTDPLASPSGFPFKVVLEKNTLSQNEVYMARERKCDLGYLRMPYERAEGAVGYRCSSEPINNYLAKGGAETETQGRKCLCNGLMSAIGLAQITKAGTLEPTLLTAGDDMAALARISNGRPYSALDVIRYLQSPVVEARRECAASL